MLYNSLLENSSVSVWSNEHGSRRSSAIVHDYTDEAGRENPVRYKVKCRAVVVRKYTPRSKIMIMGFL